LRITTEKAAAGIVLRIEGELDGGSLFDVRRAIEEARRSSEHVAIDLSAVDAMDRKAVLFFAAGEGRAIEIAGCPRHVREWIRAEARRQGTRHGSAPAKRGRLSLPARDRRRIACRWLS
jgi:ABC-type transporter Mla MlaB component